MTDQQYVKDPLLGSALDTVLGSYKIKHIAGEGGMAKVYAAVQKLTDREVAIKCLIPSTPLTPGAPDHRERFISEIATYSRLRHPNIPEIYDSGINNNNPFIVMERVKGVSSDNLIRFVKGRLELREIYVIMKDVSNALDHAHKKNIIHRDLKPENVFISEDGRVLLGDFGVAYDQESLEKTRDSTRIPGTVGYMSRWQIDPIMMDIDEKDVINVHGKEFYARNGQIVSRKKGKGTPQVRKMGAESDLSVLGKQFFFTHYNGWHYFEPTTGDTVDKVNQEILRTPGWRIALSLKKPEYPGEDVEKINLGASIYLKKIPLKASRKNIKKTYHNGAELMKDFDYPIQFQYGKNYKVDEKACIKSIFSKLDKEVDKRYDSLVNGEINKILDLQGELFNITEKRMRVLKEDLSLVFERLNYEKRKNLADLINSNINRLLINHEKGNITGKKAHEFYFELLKNIPQYHTGGYCEEELSKIMGVLNEKS